MIANEDGTWSALCYCGWCNHGHSTESSAEKAAAEHQHAFDSAERGL